MSSFLHLPIPRHQWGKTGEYYTVFLRIPVRILSFLPLINRGSTAVQFQKKQEPLLGFA